MFILSQCVLTHYEVVQYIFACMDEEITHSALLVRLGQEVKDYPAPLSRIDAALAKLSLEYPDQVTEQMRKAAVDVNRQAIEQKFILMMQHVFEAIEPQLPNYQKHKNIFYLDATIRKHLDPSIYHKGYRLHKSKETPMGELLEDRDLDLTNRFFNELFDVMNELLHTMKIYYGYENDEQISEALYASISTFAEDNEQSFLVNQDNRITLLEEQRMSKIKDKNQKEGPVPYEVLVDVLNAVGNDHQAIKKNNSNKNILDKSINLVGVFYKYAIAPTVSTTYQKIKSVNPFSPNENLSSKEQEELKMKLIEHLQPNLSFHQPLDEKIVTMLIKFMPMDSVRIIKTMSQAEKQEFTNLITDVLNTFENPSGSFAEIVKEIMHILEQTMEIDVTQSEDLFVEQKQAKWLIIFYKAFEAKYNPERRRVLLNISKHKCIKEQLLNPFAIIKLVQSEDDVESPILSKLRALPVKGKEKGPSKIQRLSKDKIDDTWLNIEHELNRIHLYEFKKKHKKVPLLQFEKLTPHSNKKTITFLFSGFMSQDSCKFSEWEGILDNVYDSEVYSVRWESNTYGGVLDYAIGGVKDIAEANLKLGLIGSIGGPYLRAAAIIRQIYKKYNSNPFNPAFESAIITGEFLAEFLINNFKGHFINLVAFSLGTELVKNILKRMAQKNCLEMVNKVYLMGGAADKKQYEQILKMSKVPLNIVNLHSDNDGALKYLLRICKPQIEPIGIHQIEEVPGHLVVNQDCTSVVNGHMSYRENMRVLARLLNMKDD